MPWKIFRSKVFSVTQELQRPRLSLMFSDSDKSVKSLISSATGPTTSTKAVSLELSDQTRQTNDPVSLSSSPSLVFAGDLQILPTS